MNSWSSTFCDVAREVANSAKKVSSTRTTSLCTYWINMLKFVSDLILHGKTFLKEIYRPFEWRLSENLRDNWALILLLAFSLNQLEIFFLSMSRVIFANLLIVVKIMGHRLLSLSLVSHLMSLFDHNQVLIWLHWFQVIIKKIKSLPLFPLIS